MESEKIDLSIIILNYNAKDYLVKCLESVLEGVGIARRQGYKTEVVVVDNASIDGSIEKVQSSKFKVKKFIRNKKNLGFAAGNNKAIPYASGRYILFLNPDTVVASDTFGKMLEFMDKNLRAGVATCRLVLPNGTLDEACHRGFPTPWRAFCHFSGLEKVFSKNRFFNGYLLGHLPTDKTCEIDSCSGAFFLIRRELGSRLQWWDKDYFWYGEDLDFCYRVKEAGYKVYFVADTEIIHHKGVTSGIKKHSKNNATATKETKLRSAHASIEAMRTFYRKHYLKKYPRLVTWLVFFSMNILEKLRVATV
jgi:GT2 family glycosyltransferase